MEISSTSCDVFDSVVRVKNANLVVLKKVRACQCHNIRLVYCRTLPVNQ